MSFKMVQSNKYLQHVYIDISVLRMMVFVQKVHGVCGNG